MTTVGRELAPAIQKTIGFCVIPRSAGPWESPGIVSVSPQHFDRLYQEIATSLRSSQDIVGGMHDK